MTEPQHRPVTDEDRAQSAEAIEQLKRDIAATGRHARPPRPGKFDEPIGLDADGNFQPPLTPEEVARLEEIRRRAVDE